VLPVYSAGGPGAIAPVLIPAGRAPLSHTHTVSDKFLMSAWYNLSIEYVEICEQRLDHRSSDGERL